MGSSPISYCEIKERPEDNGQQHTISEALLQGQAHCRKKLLSHSFCTCIRHNLELIFLEPPVVFHSSIVASHYFHLHNIEQLPPTSCKSGYIRKKTIRNKCSHIPSISSIKKEWLLCNSLYLRVAANATKHSLSTQRFYTTHDTKLFWRKMESRRV